MKFFNDVPFENPTLLTDNNANNNFTKNLHKKSDLYFQWYIVH